MSRIVGSYVLKCSPLASTVPLPATTASMAGAIKKAVFCLRPPALAASSRKCGLCWEFQFGRGAVRATRSFSQVLTPVTSQWSESEPQQGRGVEQADSAKTDFPRPPTVVWSKELANRVHFIGRLGRDMEVKYLDTGKVVAKSSLAVKRSSKKDDAPSWLEMEFWDTLAHVAGQHLKKGDQIYVTGYLKVDAYLKDEVQQKITRVVVQDLNFVEQSYYQEAGVTDWASQSPPVGASMPQPSGQYPAANSYPEMEKAWNEYFSDPTQWWDNRGKKQNPRYPDFKHKTTNEALWIDSYKTPKWVPGQLEKLEAARRQFEASRGKSAGRTQHDPNFMDFKDF
ncbi:unnamed protein product [Sphagnum balticum]